MSLLAAVVGVHVFQGSRWTLTREGPLAQGNHHSSICLYGVLRCAHGMLHIAVGSEGLGKRFAPAFDIDIDGPGMATNPDRIRNRDSVIALVGGLFADWKLANRLPLLGEVGVPADEVRSLDRGHKLEETLSQGLVVEIEHPMLGSVQLPGPAARVGHNPSAGGPDRHQPPPSVGEHNDSVLTVAR